MAQIFAAGAVEQHIVAGPHGAEQVAAGRQLADQVRQRLLQRGGVILRTPVVRPGGWRLAIALLSSLGGLIFGIGIAMGQLTIAIAAWVIGGLLSLIPLIAGKPDGTHGDGS